MAERTAGQLSPDWHAGWQQGTLDETTARDEGLSDDAKQLRDTLDVLTRLPRRLSDDEQADLAASLACIYLAGRPLRRRLQLAWELIRG